MAGSKKRKQRIITVARTSIKPNHSTVRDLLDVVRISDEEHLQPFGGHQVIDDRLPSVVVTTEDTETKFN